MWPTDHAAERGLLAPGTADLAFNENIAVHATERLASGNAVALVAGRSGARKSGWRNTGGGVRNLIVVMAAAGAGMER